MRRSIGSRVEDGARKREFNGRVANESMNSPCEDGKRGDQPAHDEEGILARAIPWAMGAEVGEVEHRQSETQNTSKNTFWEPPKPL